MFWIGPESAQVQVAVVDANGIHRVGGVYESIDVRGGNACPRAVELAQKLNLLECPRQYAEWLRGTE